jgi:hypothetical protein
MTNQTHRNALAAVLAAAAFMATAMPGAASGGDTSLMQGERDGSALYVTHGGQANGPTVPHRPESDLHFPRR